MSLFRASITIVLILFSVGSFGYALKLQDAFNRQERHLWCSRSEAYLLRASLDSLKEEKEYLSARMAEIEGELAGTLSNLARARVRIPQLEIALGESTRERESLVSMNRKLERSRAQLAREHQLMIEEVFNVYAAANEDRWLDAIREAGDWLAMNVTALVQEVRSAVKPAPRGSLADRDRDFSQAGHFPADPFLLPDHVDEVRSLIQK